MQNRTTFGNQFWCIPCCKYVSKKDAQHVGSVTHLMAMGLSKPEATARARKYGCCHCGRGFTRSRDMTRHLPKCPRNPNPAKTGCSIETPSNESVQGPDQSSESWMAASLISSGSTRANSTSPETQATTRTYRTDRGNSTSNELMSSAFGTREDTSPGFGTSRYAFSTNIYHRSDAGTTVADTTPGAMTDYEAAMHVAGTCDQHTATSTTVDAENSYDSCLAGIPTDVPRRYKDVPSAMGRPYQSSCPEGPTPRSTESNGREGVFKSGEDDAKKFAKAILDDDLAAVEGMLSSGLSVNTFLRGHRNKRFSRPIKPFGLAAYLGRTQILCCIIKHASSPEVLGRVSSRSPLRDILLAKDFTCAEVLVLAGASVNQRTHGQTLVEFFAFRGCSASVKFLVVHGAPVTSQALRIPFLETLCIDEYARLPNSQGEPINGDYLGYLDVLRCLGDSQNWATPTVLGEFLKLALPKAVAAQREQLVRWLIRVGADIHQQNGFSNGSALLDAALLGDVEMVTLLLSEGFNADSDAGYLSLCTAARTANTTMMNHLVSYGAPVDLIARLGHSPLYFAVQLGNLKNVRLILRAVEAQRESNESAIWRTPVDNMYKAEFYALREWEAVVRPAEDCGMYPRMQPMVDMLKRILNERKLQDV